MIGGGSGRSGRASTQLMRSVISRDSARTRQCVNSRDSAEVAQTGGDDITRGHDAADLGLALGSGTDGLLEDHLGHCVARAVTEGGDGSAEKSGRHPLRSPGSAGPT
jgi:hypothetical protein